MPKEWKASYTVEASWIMSICIFLVFFTLSVSIAMYREAYTFVEETSVKEIDAVTKFRQFALGKEVLGIE